MLEKFSMRTFTYRLSPISYGNIEKALTQLGK